MTRFALLPLVLLAAACATPREACIADQTEELRVLDSLIAQDEATLARGYALDRRTEYAPSLTLCSGIGYWGGYRDLYGGTGTCIRPEPRTRTVPVAVNLEEIRARLASLKAKRVDLAQEVELGVAACRQAYPEG